MKQKLNMESWIIMFEQLMYCFHTKYYNDLVLYIHCQMSFHATKINVCTGWILWHEKICLTVSHTVLLYVCISWKKKCIAYELNMVLYVNYFWHEDITFLYYT